MSLLEIENLRLSIGGVPILKDIDLTLEQGEVMGLVGESGSGKSMTASAIMRLLPAGVRVDSGSIEYEGRDLLALDEAQMRRVRGAHTPPAARA